MKLGGKDPIKDNVSSGISKVLAYKRGAGMKEIKGRENLIMKLLKKQEENKPQNAWKESFLEFMRAIKNRKKIQKVV